MSELADVVEFRNRLVRYMNLGIMAGGGFYGNELTEADQRFLGEERPWLRQEYGRLYRVINRWGATSMGSPALGVTTVDVVQDAITKVGGFSYGDICRFAEQHLDTVIGRLQDQEQRRSVGPDVFYRATSIGFWLHQLARGVGWLFATTGRRIVAIIGAVALALLTAVVSGWTQAMFTP